MAMAYPLYCMKMSDFLKLESLEPHNSLVERGLVVPVDLDGAHKGQQVEFVSHQWLGFSMADPNGEHLRTMQAAFKRAATEPYKLFKTEDDLTAFTQGLTGANLETLLNTVKSEIYDDEQWKKREAALEKDAEGNVLVAGSAGQTQGVAELLAAFQKNVADSWVWMDYISVPQTINLRDEVEVKEALRKQALAIRSIGQTLRSGGARAADRAHD